MRIKTTVAEHDFAEGNEDVAAMLLLMVVRMLVNVAETQDYDDISCCIVCTDDNRNGDNSDDTTDDDDQEDNDQEDNES